MSRTRGALITILVLAILIGLYGNYVYINEYGDYCPGPRCGTAQSPISPNPGGSTSLMSSTTTSSTTRPSLAFTSSSAITTSPSNETMTTVSSSSISLPPPTTTVIGRGCQVLAPSPSTQVSSSSTNSTTTAIFVYHPLAVIVNYSGNYAQELFVNAGKFAQIAAISCSYSNTNTTTPIACGVMCGNGIGYIYNYQAVWQLNFSIGPAIDGSMTGQNISIGSLSELSLAFPERAIQVVVTSQPVTWYSNPPCYDQQGIQGDCMQQNANSITIVLPSSQQSGTFQLTITSSETLVP